MRVPAARSLPRRYARAIMIRGVALWVLARVLVFAIAMFVVAMTGTDPIGAGDLLRGTNMVVASWVVVLSVALVLLDLHRRHEIALLNNLGVTTTVAVVLGSLPAAIMETLIQVLTA